MTGFDPVGLLNRLARGDITFVVVGGFAVIAHGVVRATQDLDICPSPAVGNLERLARLLVDIDAQQLGVGGFEPDEMPIDPRDPEQLASGGNFRLTTALGGLDVMQWLPGLPEDGAFAALHAEALEVEVEGDEILVASLAHLRAMKQAAGRPGDLEDLRRLALAHPQ